MDRETAIINSALWAAYGDALGFISELTDEAGLEQRSGVQSLSTTVPWKRRVGGKYGVQVELPAGCYSDDTQLRLAVSRCIDATGFFDVEAFAKVELPLWRNYRLGAGRGSKLAATNLTRKEVTWATNFYSNDKIKYVNGGGNGAAMRIQPHVWSFSQGSSIDVLIRDIIRNAITTHGHPRGILGAVFHGLCLFFALKEEALPSVKDWKTILEKMKTVARIVANDDQLSYRWLPEWERQTDNKFDEACQTVLNEIKIDIEAIETHLSTDDQGQYKALVSAIDAFNPACRGSGTKTALLASALSLLCSENPEGAVIISANTLGSDTDTIGTMVGALAGTLLKTSPKGELTDSDYITKEAQRTYQISQRKAKQSFMYPDLLNWDPPTNHLDSVKMSRFGVVFSAFGKIVPADGIEYDRAGKYPVAWRWYSLATGQRILLKHRKPIEQDRTLPEPSTGVYRNIVVNQQRPEQAQLPLNLEEPISQQKKQFTIDDAFEQVRKSEFSPKTIGEIFLKITDADDNIERAVAFAALVCKARQERKKRET